MDVTQPIRRSFADEHVIASTRRSAGPAERLATADQRLRRARAVGHGDEREQALAQDAAALCGYPCSGTVEQLWSVLNGCDRSRSRGARIQVSAGLGIARKRRGHLDRANRALTLATCR